MNGSAVQVFSDVRAFFAPVNQGVTAPVGFDGIAAVQFDSNAPCAPWIDLGPIIHLRRASTSERKSLRTGKAGGLSAQALTQLGARVEFDFVRWGKLQMALAAGVQHQNVLAQTGGQTATACAALSGSSSTRLVFSTADSARFRAGDVVVADADYAGQSGPLGAGISGTYVKAAQSGDVNLIRRYSFNVARVSALAGNAVELDRPLLAGVPSGAKVQKIIGFTDREGGSFVQQWSALFVAEGETGGRVCFYYPRLQSAPAGPDRVWPVEAAGERRVAAAVANESASWHGGLSIATLHAAFIAAPITDSVDGEQAVCYRTYVPSATAPVY